MFSQALIAQIVSVMAPYSLADGYQVSEEDAASIFRRRQHTLLNIHIGLQGYTEAQPRRP
jgi:hypothetical protein